MKRKNYPQKSGISRSGVRISGAVYMEGRCVAKINDQTISEFETQIGLIKRKFS